MKKWMIAIILLASIGLQQTTLASELMDKFAIRITVIANQVVYEWEYDSPNKYEFEKGDKIVRGSEAQNEVERMVSLLALKEGADVAEMVKILKKNGFEEIERLDIRMMNGEGKLFTWVWDKSLQKS